MKRRIAIVLREMDWGGAEVTTLNLACYLQRNGFVVEIITTGRGPGCWFGRIAEAGLKGIHIEGRFKYHPLVHSYRVGRKLLASEYDIIILCNTEKYAQASINMLPSRVIVIPWIHCDAEEAYRQALINEDAWNVAVGVSPKVAGTVASMADNRSVKCILNGIEPIERKIWQGRCKHDAPLRILFVGRMEEWSKGILYLPEIMKGCRERGLTSVLTVIGDGKDIATIKAKAADLCVQDMMHFMGFLHPADVKRWLLYSHVLVMPSVSEGLGLVQLEAQMCGCVPIISRLKDATDITVDDGRTGFLVEVGNVDRFVNAIELLSKDPQRWLAMSIAGHEKIMSEFSVEIMGKNFLKLISDALDGHYPLPHSRLNFLPVNPLSFKWKEHIPRSIHRLGLGSRIRKTFGLSD